MSIYAEFKLLFANSLLVDPFLALALLQITIDPFFYLKQFPMEAFLINRSEYCHIKRRFFVIV